MRSNTVTKVNTPDEVHTRNFAQRVVGRLADMTILQLLPSKSANLRQCRQDDMWDIYFREAEGQFEGQWKETIWPIVRDFDFDTVLELSPGVGRNTEKLSELTSRLIAVDYNQHALEQTRARLGSGGSGCAISYHQNNGFDLRMVPDASVTAIYCWDSAVHFDKTVVLAYIREFARVLKLGGSGFLHHSDLGDRAHKNIKRNPHWRSNVSKELVARACQAEGLTVVEQRQVPWPPIVDCATVFRKDAFNPDR
jgi:ubiquinone/menaquinone biosynthesis C-methylase UbiE